MSRTLDYPPVTDKLLQEIVHRILAVGAPPKSSCSAHRPGGMPDRTVISIS